jgi:hypothetical protein
MTPAALAAKHLFMPPLTAPALPITGAVGSPTHPLAIK